MEISGILPSGVARVQAGDGAQASPLAGPDRAALFARLLVNPGAGRAATPVGPSAEPRANDHGGEAEPFAPPMGESNGSDPQSATLTTDDVRHMAPLPSRAEQLPDPGAEGPLNGRVAAQPAASEAQAAWLSVLLPEGDRAAAALRPVQETKPLLLHTSARSANVAGSAQSPVPQAPGPAVSAETRPADAAPVEDAGKPMGETRGPVPGMESPSVMRTLGILQDPDQAMFSGVVRQEAELPAAVAGDGKNAAAGQAPGPAFRPNDGIGGTRAEPDRPLALLRQDTAAVARPPEFAVNQPAGRNSGAIVEQTVAPARAHAPAAHFPAGPQLGWDVPTGQSPGAGSVGEVPTFPQPPRSAVSQGLATAYSELRADVGPRQPDSRQALLPLHIGSAGAHVIPQPRVSGTAPEAPADRSPGIGTQPQEMPRIALHASGVAQLRFETARGGNRYADAPLAISASGMGRPDVPAAALKAHAPMSGGMGLLPTGLNPDRPEIQPLESGLPVTGSAEPRGAGALTATAMTGAPAGASAQQAAALMQQVIQVSGHLANGPIEVSLSPEELGRVRMTLTPGENGMILSILADRDETLALLRRNLDMLTSDLRDLGFANLSFQFGSGGSGENRHGREQAIAPAHFAQDLPASVGPAGPQPSTSALPKDRLDLRL